MLKSVYVKFQLEKIHRLIFYLLLFKADDVEMEMAQKHQVLQKIIVEDVVRFYPFCPCF